MDSIKQKVDMDLIQPVPACVFDVSLSLLGCYILFYVSVYWMQLGERVKRGP